MKKGTLVAILILIIAIACLALITKYKRVKYTLVDICFMYYPENYGNYPYVQGFWNSANNPTLTVTVDGKIVHSEFTFDVLEATYDTYYGGVLSADYKICNANGECLTYEGDSLYAFNYQNDYSNCVNDCNKYNVVGQCKYASKTPVPYTCDYICRYQSNLYIPSLIETAQNKLTPTPTYTITITKVRYYDKNTYTWKDADPSKYPYIAYAVWYNPNEKPWEPKTPSREINLVFIGVLSILGLAGIVIAIIAKR